MDRQSPVHPMLMRSHTNGPPSMNHTQHYEMQEKKEKGEPPSPMPAARAGGLSPHAEVMRARHAEIQGCDTNYRGADAYLHHIRPADVGKRGHFEEENAQSEQEDDRRSVIVVNII